MTKRLAAFASAALLTIAVALMLSIGASRGPVLAQSAGAVPFDALSRGLHLTLGLGDSEAADWSGRIDTRRPRVAQFEGVAGSAAGWTARTDRGRSKKAAKTEGPIIPLEIAAVIRDNGAITFETAQGDISVEPQSLALGRPRTFLGGRVEIERTPPFARLTRSELDEDFPACDAAPSGDIWCAYVAYDLGAQIDADATARGEFDSLIATGNGDQIRTLRYSDGLWTPGPTLSESGADVWRPSVAAGAGGRIQVVWSQKIGGDWELLGRNFDSTSDRPGEVERLTSNRGADFNPQLARSSDGKIWVAWQAWNNGQFDIRLGQLGGGPPAPRRVSPSAANDWNPSLAAGPDGSVWVAWDSYDNGNYDVYARRFSGSQADAPVAIASSAKFEARASVAVDSQGRVWVAYEEGAENWGKDSGDRWPGRQGASFYGNRYFRLRCLDNGRVRETASSFQSELIETYHDDPMQPTVLEHRVSMPRLSIDDSGRPWVLFRRHALRSGLGELWAGYAAYYEGATWSPQIALLHSNNLIDNRPAAVPHRGGVLVVHSTDKRKTAVRDAEDNDLYAAFLAAGSSAQPPALIDVEVEGHTRPAIPIHRDETADIERLRSERVTVGGKTYRYLRGEFHRHTEISSHRDWDGPLEDVWRYGLDVAAMDWIGPGDHDFGVGRDYLWWLQQKQIDLFHHAGSFLPMFTYERSQGYPSGHRNIMFGRRGIRPLPRLEGREAQFGTEEGGSADIRNVYAWLKHFGGIASSHTSATNMGTDWRDADAEVEPVVEIFQGHRLSAEETNAPMAPRGEQDAIQGYRPKGFVWEAFKKGVRLGFQASSDHISTHISYGTVLVEEATREGVIDAFKQRHCYAAQDNVLLEVRSGERLMGDEFSTRRAPRLDIRVIGTTPIRKIDIVRQVEHGDPAYVASFEPGEQTVEMSWTDRDASGGKVNMYYVRIQQENEALAWASPMWIRYR